MLSFHGRSDAFWRGDKVVPFSNMKDVERWIARSQDRKQHLISRRGFLGGMGAIMSAPAFAQTTLFENVPYLSGAPGSTTTKRTPGQRATDIITPYDFGAVGNGIADDTAALQACFNAAFGPYTSPTGTGQFGNTTNTAINMVRGKYLTTAPIYAANVTNGWIFGQGAEIFFSPSMKQNALETSSDITAIGLLTPALMLDGWGYSRIEGIGIKGNNTLAQTDSSIQGIWQYQSGMNGYSGTSIYRNMGIATLGGAGVLGGSPGSANCDNCMFENVNFNTCNFGGLRLITLNVLNWASYNGGGDFNAAAATSISDGIALYSCVGGTICVFNASMSANIIDFFNNGGNSTIIGGSSEPQVSGMWTSLGTFVIGQPTSVISHAYRSGGDSTYLDLSLGGTCHAIECQYGPGSNSGAGIVAKLGNGGYMIFDGLSIGANAGTGCRITGSSVSKLFIRGTFNLSGANILSGFGGSVLVNADAGVTCSGINAGTFTSQNGIITHC